jgi:hypothetical protein
MCLELYCRVIIEHKINMAAASKTGIMFKFLSFQENLNNINKVDATSNVSCKKSLKNLAFVCHLEIWLYQIVKQYPQTAELGKYENSKIQAGTYGMFLANMFFFFPSSLVLAEIYVVLHSRVCQNH